MNILPPEDIKTAMEYHQIFRNSPAATQSEIVAGLMASEREAYKAAIEALAPAANVRPVFVMRMPTEKRHSWVARQLGRKASEAIAGNVLQYWLSGPCKQMLIDFLDQLGIEHQDGLIEELPESPPAGKLAGAVDTIMANYPREHVAIYLQVFQAMDLASWPELDSIIEEQLQTNQPPVN
jgi:hypothetical protein